eukprot:CAMPEP_0174264664 /NCGR_PEP_ID=MMETSP0439-20130205/23385_1 /TAXON_ID=0 /ORGANISM="Stereomyxa ramosa, Strain Chinc5" /LENGTH=123 /DNA_ID=CAMNT_0015350671 /DNA_START=441 /DNA_END=809 /DNA_ORIENTATION=+
MALGMSLYQTHVLGEPGLGIWFLMAAFALIPGVSGMIWEISLYIARENHVMDENVQNANFTIHETQSTLHSDDDDTELAIPEAFRSIGGRKLSTVEKMSKIVVSNSTIFLVLLLGIQLVMYSV